MPGAAMFVASQFYSIAATISSAKTWKRAIVIGLSCLFNWRSFGPESHLKPIEPAVLLVGYG